MEYCCSRCNTIFGDNMSHIRDDKQIYCWECSYILGYIEEEKYIKNCGTCVTNLRAYIVDGKIYLAKGNVTKDEKIKSRNYSQYRKWRSMVLKRDLFTCQICGNVGGELHVHHIKSYSNYPELRTDVNNGITLCNKCHEELHKTAVR